jgi:hypothetical protein
VEAIEEPDCGNDQLSLGHYYEETRKTWRSPGKDPMTKEEMFRKNQQLSTEFELYLLDHPEIEDT